MAENSEAESQLKALGLTEYEARAYVTLLRYGTLTAERISELGRIPLPRVYDTISELQKKGFVLISRSRPKVFRSVSAKKGLDNYLELQRQQTEQGLANLRDGAAAAVDILGSIPAPTAAMGGGELTGTWSIEKRSNILRMLYDEATETRKELMVFAGDLSWISDIAPAFRAAARRGVKLRVLMHDTKSPSVLANMRLAKKVGCQVRTGYTGLLRGQIIDDKHVHVATKFSGAGINALEEGRPGGSDARYEMIIFDNPALIDAIRQYFEFWWKSLGR